MKQIHYLCNVTFGGGEVILLNSEKEISDKISVKYLRKSKLISENDNDFFSKISAKQQYNFLDQIINLFLCLFLVLRINYKQHVSMKNIFVFHGYPFQYLTWIVKLLGRGRIRICMVFHQRKETKSWLHKLNSKIEIMTLKNISVFTVSKENKKYLEKYFKNKVPISIFNLPYFPLKIKNQNSKQNKDICNLICVGRFDTVKGHYRLIEWFYTNKDRMHNYHLHLVGNGPLEKELKIQVEKNNLLKSVTFHGHLDRSKLLDIYSLSDIMICSSYSEAAPVTFLEGIEFRLPVFVFEETLMLYENNFHIKDFFKDCLYLDQINWKKCEGNVVNVDDAFKVFESY